ncbi:MAG: DUF308 domain-containing protein [Candidatus Nanopelagicales bacterium]
MAQTDPISEEAREAVAAVSKLWWLSLVTGILWFFIAIVILQFDTASVTTVGVIVGAMFLFTGLQQFVISTVVDGWKWLWIVFGVLFVLAGIYALVNPGATTAALADSLGFLFLLVAIFWTIEAFATRHSNELWWLGLLSGIIMLVLAFWVSGQFFFTRVYILLVFAGIWALLQGVNDIIRAFQLKRVGKLATS